jgi:hypothetical protein
LTATEKTAGRNAGASCRGGSKGESWLRFIPTYIHGIADYIVALFVCGVPFVYGMAGPAQLLLAALGLAAILYSLMTRYEWGLLPLISLPLHLAFDLLFGIIMIASLYFFDYPGSSRALIGLIGVLSLALVTVTKTRPTKRSFFS